MSIALMTLAFKATVPSTQKLVLLALCDCANDQGECYPSIPNLMDKCSLGERTVQEAISFLEGMGLLVRAFRPGRATLYTMTPAAAAPHPRSSRTQNHKGTVIRTVKEADSGIGQPADPARICR